MSALFSRIQMNSQNNFCQKLEMEDGIAMNENLQENLFVSIICMLNKVPVFLVGKPGTSKTLRFVDFFVHCSCVV